MKKITNLIIFSVIAIFFGSAVFYGADEPAKRHPSYSLLGRDKPPADSPLNPNFVVSNEANIKESSLWRSSYIPDRLVGLDVADIDGDGRNELVYVTPHNVYLARRSGPILEQLATFSTENNITIVSVDLFDTDNNGKKEIILSAQYSDQTASSLVLAYNGSKELQLLVKNLSWYLRVTGPAGQRRLTGQKPSTNSNESYGGKPHYVEFKDGEIKSQGLVPVPRNINLYSFNIGNLGTQNTRLVAAIKSVDEHLTLFDTGGGKVWESPDSYAGTTNHIVLPTYREQSPNLVFLPTRLIIDDIDSDGINEIIVAKNNQGGVPFMKNLRSYNSGIIEARKFTNLSLVPFFNSANLLPGPAVDYVFQDFDNNGTKDLVVGVVIDTGSGMMRDGRSVIVGYIDLYSQKPEQEETAQPVATTRR
ncbi:MAG: VCBS repeat-containing protein [Deltaproteobacteria bacterium]|nr:VCBS repeat-containing protein [Deltaproteobacteria bacterium]